MPIFSSPFGFVRLGGLIPFSPMPWSVFPSRGLVFWAAVLARCGVRIGPLTKPQLITTTLFQTLDSLVQGPLGLGFFSIAHAARPFCVRSFCFW